MPTIKELIQRVTDGDINAVYFLAKSYHDVKNGYAPAQFALDNITKIVIISLTAKPPAGPRFPLVGKICNTKLSQLLLSIQYLVKTHTWG